jgi:hypothetical protein
MTVNARALNTEQRQRERLGLTKDTPSDAVSIAEMLPPTVDPTVCKDDTSAKIDPSAPSGTICPIITQIGIEMNWLAITPTRSSPMAKTYEAAMNTRKAHQSISHRAIKIVTTHWEEQRRRWLAYQV